jgi:hypothetical protein
MIASIALNIILFNLALRVTGGYRDVLFSLFGANIGLILFYILGVI